MSIKKLPDGRYEVDIRPDGRNGRRIRRKFIKRHEAAAFERHIISSKDDRPWLDKPADARSLSELIETWFKYIGKNSDHGDSQRLKLLRICDVMSNPASFQIDATKITEYRAARISDGVKASTVNREVTTLGGMYTALIGAGLFRDKHPVRGLGRLREANTSMAYLTPEEIAALLVALEGDNRRIALLCLSTGARWGEAANLRCEQIAHNRVTFIKTKTHAVRSVPLSDEVVKEIVVRGSGLMFPRHNYRLFRETLRQVKPDLPQGQASHVMRHTFATHFIINGGSLITLQRILGHTTITQTMKYAHFSPDYLVDAIRFNPLRGGIGVAETASTPCPHPEGL